MPGLDDLLAETFKKAAQVHQFKSISLGIATNITDTVCDVEREDDDTLLGVRLQAVEDTLTSRIRVKPADGSVVIVGIIDNLESEACIIQCSEIDEVLVQIGEVEFSINANGVLMQKGTDTLKNGLQLMGEAIQPIFVLYGNNPAFLKLQQSMAIFNNLLR